MPVAIHYLKRNGVHFGFGLSPETNHAEVIRDRLVAVHEESDGG